MRDEVHSVYSGSVYNKIHSIYSGLVYNKIYSVYNERGWKEGFLS